MEGMPSWPGGVSKGAEERMCRASSRTEDQVSALVRGWGGASGHQGCQVGRASQNGLDSAP